jgi:hypothetical protein
MEPEVFLSWPEELATGYCHKPDESKSRSHHVFISTCPCGVFLTDFLIKIL